MEDPPKLTPMQQYMNRNLQKQGSTLRAQALAASAAMRWKRKTDFSKIEYTPVEKWLRSLSLELHFDKFHSRSIDTMDKVADITALQLFGMQLPENAQAKLLKSIQKMKKVKNAKLAEERKRRALEEEAIQEKRRKQVAAQERKIALKEEKERLRLQKIAADMEKFKSRAKPKKKNGRNSKMHKSALRAVIAQ